VPEEEALQFGVRQEEEAPSAHGPASRKYRCVLEERWCCCGAALVEWRHACLPACLAISSYMGHEAILGSVAAALEL
jgi:hypothetical protein